MPSTNPNPNQQSPHPPPTPSTLPPSTALQALPQASKPRSPSTALQAFETRMSSSSSASSQQSRNVDRRLRDVMRERPPPANIPNCNCGVPIKLKSSWTAKNPCRRFGVCSYNMCSYWTWLDKEEAPKHTRDVANILIDKYGELGMENESLKRIIRELKSSLLRPSGCVDCASLMNRCKELENELVKKERHLFQEKNIYIWAF